MTRRLLSFLTLAVAAPTIGVATAAAAPIVPGAAPLWLMADDAELPSGCPSAGLINGSEMVEAVKRGSARDRGEIIVSLAMVDSLLRRPTVLACDPAQHAARTMPGPITGDSALAMQDRVFWGERALLGTATEGADGLRSGDRLAFPPLGSTASVDLAVAAGDATTTVRIPQSTDQPTAARIVGTSTGPTVVVTRASGAEQTVPVAVPPPSRYRIAWRRTGDRITARVRTILGRSS